MNIRNPVLLVVDMQNGFLNAHSEYVIPHVFRLVEECEKRNLPVIFTVFQNIVGSSFERLIGWERVRNRPDVDLYGDFKRIARVVIEKEFYTAFTDEFAKLVIDRGWETILICGVATESCVLKTAVDAFERDLLPIVVSDACSSDAGIKIHDMGLAILEILIGKNQIIPIDEVLKYLDR